MRPKAFLAADDVTPSSPSPKSAPPLTPDAPERDEGEAASLPVPVAFQKIKSHAPLAPVTLKSVVALATPAIVDQILAAIIGLTDTLLAGHLPGDANTVAASAAAVGLMTYLQWFCGLMTSAVGTGATAIVARSVGARRVRVANRVAGTAVSAAFITGVILAVFLFTFARPLIHIFGLRGQAAVFAVEYLRVMVITVCFQTAAQIGAACLRGAGDTVRPMFITAATMVVNGLFSTAFTFGLLGAPAWGVRGNAFGTLLAYLTSGIAIAFLLFTGRAGLKLQPRHLKIVPHVLMRLLKIGLPSWAEGLLLWGGQFAIVILVVTTGDPNGVTMAAHTAVLRIESISFLPGFGFGMAASALVGQYLGSRQPAQARRAAFIATNLAFFIMTLLAVPMVVWPRPLLRAMVDSGPVVAVGAWPLILAGLAQPAFAYAIGFSGALKGAGETLWPMICTLVGIFAVRLPIVILLCLTVWRLGLTGLWIAICIDLAFRAGFNGVVFLRGAWELKKV